MGRIMKPLPKSFSWIAKETGLSVSHISRVFRGERTPSLSSLIHIAKAMNITTDKLVTILKKGKTNGKEGKGESEG